MEQGSNSRFLKRECLEASFQGIHDVNEMILKNRLFPWECLNYQA